MSHGLLANVSSKAVPKLSIHVVESHDELPDAEHFQCTADAALGLDSLLLQTSFSLPELIVSLSRFPGSSTTFMLSETAW